MSVFVTNVASMIGIGVAVDYSLFVLARYREEIRGGREPRRRAPGRAAHVGAGGRLLRHHGDRLARRPVPGRLDHDALDGDGGDHRRRGLDPRRGDAAAGADAPARPARLRARPAGDRGRPAGRAMPAHAPAPPRLDRARDAAARLLGALDRDASCAGPWVSAIGQRRGAARAGHPGALAPVGDGALRQFPKGNETRVGAELAARRPARAPPARSRSSRRFDNGRGGRRREPRARSARYVAELRTRSRGRRGRAAAAIARRPRGADRGASRGTTRRAPQADALVDRLRAGSPARSRGVADVQVGGATAFVRTSATWSPARCGRSSLFVLALQLPGAVRAAALGAAAAEGGVMNLLSVGAAYGVLVWSSSTAGSTACSATTRSATSTR